MGETIRHILVVEDDADIAELVRLNLADEGYAVDWAADGEAGLARIKAGPSPGAAYDALILDIMLPDIDGLEVCRQARTMPQYTPIIIISAKSAETHRVLGLELGADDYVTKPFSVLELIARVKALFRRVDALGKAARQDAGVVELGGLAIDPVAREVRVDDQPLDLTAREFDLLFFFARQPGRVFSRLDLLNQVWGYSHEGYEHTVNTHINRLRNKIERDPAHPVLIRTVWGVGYKFTPNGTEEATA
ncbi:MAG TPA: response regulator transcription factor [Thiobacillaceae bacterium]|nr:response regulator transcription factor [Thiobacillaceae bacterium]